MESILDSIKHLVGIEEDEDNFDLDIILHINSVFSDLHQMGVGPKEPFVIDDEKTTWSEFTDSDSLFNNVKTYMYLRVKLIFDPPASSSVLAAMQREADKLEWRLSVSASNKAMEESENE